MKRNHFGITILSLVCLLAAGCSSGKSTTTTTTTPGGGGGFQITQPTTSPAIDVGQSVAFTANQAALWSLQSGNGNPPLGTLSNTTTATTTVTYTAPSSVTAAREVIVVATSTSDSTQTASITVAINPPPVVGASGNLSANTSCLYDPINRIGTSNGTTNSPYPTHGNPPQVSGGTGPYTWSVSSGSLPVGLALGWAATTNPPSPSSAFLYGTPVSAGCSQIALQVTDGTGVTAASPTYYVVITPPALKIQVPNYADAYSGAPYPPTALSVSGGVPPYQSWSVFDPVSMPPGVSLTPDAQNSGAAYLSGTPSGGGSLGGNSGLPYTPTLQVVDSQTPYPAYGSVGLSVYQWASSLSSPCTPAQNANGSGSITTNLTGMNGSYAYLLRGFDVDGPVVFAGSFTADGNGNITGGVEDAMSTAGSQAGVAISGGSYSIIQQNNSSGANTFAQSGCVMLTTPAGTTTFAISLGGCSTSANTTTGACVADSQGAAGVYTTGRMIEFDDTTGSGTRVSGIVRLQDSSALSGGLSGSYSFGLSGRDSAGSRYAAAGSVAASSGTLSAAADINDGGALQSALTGGTGSYSMGSNGRGTGTLTLGAESLNLAFYVVSAQEVLLASTGTVSAANPIVSGEAISAAGPFSAASVQNSHIFHSAGLAHGGPDPSIGILSFDGNGGFTGTQYEDQVGTLGTTSLSGGYSVDSKTGRLSFIASSTNSQSLGDHPLVGYVVPVPTTLARQSCVQLSSCVTGFLLSTDATAQAGQLEFQTPTFAPPPPFSNLYVSGYYFYGTDESLDNSTPLLAGAAFANPNGAHYAGIQSVSYPNSTYCQQPGCALLIPNETLATSTSAGNPPGTYSINSNGTGSIGGVTVAVTNGNVTYYIDESPINLHPSVVVIEQ